MHVSGSSSLMYFMSSWVSFLFMSIILSKYSFVTISRRVRVTSPTSLLSYILGARLMVIEWLFLTIWSYKLFMSIGWFSTSSEPRILSKFDSTGGILVPKAYFSVKIGLSSWLGKNACCYIISYLSLTTRSTYSSSTCGFISFPILSTNTLTISQWLKYFISFSKMYRLRLLKAKRICWWNTVCWKWSKER